MSLSYTKAVFDYKLATQHEDKIKNSEATLSRVKIYIPSEDLCHRIKAVETDNTKGQCDVALDVMNQLVKDLEDYFGSGPNVTVKNNSRTGSISSGSGPKVTVKNINNRYKLSGVYCVKFEYHFPEDNTTIRFPADPDLIVQHAGNVEDLVGEYMEIFSAYSVSKKYIEKLRSRVTVLRDEF